MEIDQKKLLVDADRLSKARKASPSPRRTGATATITAALPEIQELREKNVAWSIIAAALAEQGAVQGADRKPLTGRRLCALLHAIKKREARRAQKRLAVRARADVVPRHETREVNIAPELAANTDRAASPVTESELRAEAFANVQSLLKGQHE